AAAVEAGDAVRIPPPDIVMAQHLRLLADGVARRQPLEAADHPFGEAIHDRLASAAWCQISPPGAIEDNGSRRSHRVSAWRPRPTPQPTHPPPPWGCPGCATAPRRGRSRRDRAAARRSTGRAARPETPGLPR